MFLTEIKMYDTVFRDTFKIFVKHNYTTPKHNPDKPSPHPFAISSNGDAYFLSTTKLVKNHETIPTVTVEQKAEKLGPGLMTVEDMQKYALQSLMLQ